MLNKSLKIAISGKSGCGNTSLGLYLSKKLGLTQINYTFRNMAEDEGVTLEDIFTRSKLTDDVDRLLDEKQVAMALATPACVLCSRLAIWVLKEADVKIYLDISVDERSRRISGREQKSFEQAKQETVNRDNNDTNRFISLYGIDNNDFSDVADIVISDDKLSTSEIAILIEAFLRNKGHL